MDLRESMLTEMIPKDDRSKWLSYSSHNIKCFTEDEIRRITSNYETIIGKGGFGEVYKGVLQDRIKVAVKKFIRNVEENFAKELKVHREINYKNVVRLIGYCAEENALMIVSEYISKGNLSDVLHHKCIPLTLDTRLHIAVECSEALCYMHSQMYTQVIHGDIKPANILLDDNFNAKISDFGISRLVNTNGILFTEHIIGNRGYMDPSFVRTGRLTLKSDVYSFGVVLVELITKKKASIGNGETDIVECFTQALATGKRKVRELFDVEISSQNNMKILEGVAKLAEQCLMLEMDRSPEMTDVAERLRVLMKTQVQGKQWQSIFPWGRRNKPAAQNSWQSSGLLMPHTLEVHVPQSLPSQGQSSGLVTPHTLPSNSCRHFSLTDMKSVTRNFDGSPLAEDDDSSYCSEIPTSEDDGMDGDEQVADSMDSKFPIGSNLCCHLSQKEMRAALRYFDESHLAEDDDSSYCSEIPSSENDGTDGDEQVVDSMDSKLPIDSNLCHHFSLREMKSATRNFDESHLVCVRGSHEIYYGVINGEAIKASKLASRDKVCVGGSHEVYHEVDIKRGRGEQDVNKFQTEIAMMAELSHHHLVSLVGYCMEESDMILVYDYMARGTLRGNLYGNNIKQPPFTWRQRLDVCISAARALHYLHEYSIIHNDVSTTNILLDERLVSKVSSNVSLRQDVMRVSSGFLFHNCHKSRCDPEFLCNRQLTEKSNVYSFGVVLFEVLYARAAWDPILRRRQVYLVKFALSCQKKGILDLIVDPYLKGRISRQCFKKFAEIAEKCVSDCGIDRPTMQEVLQDLEMCLALVEDDYCLYCHEQSMFEQVADGMDSKLTVA